MPSSRQNSAWLGAIKGVGHKLLESVSTRSHKPDKASSDPGLEQALGPVKASFDFLLTFRPLKQVRCYFSVELVRNAKNGIYAELHS